MTVLARMTVGWPVVLPAAAGMVWAAEEVVQAHLVQGGGPGIRGDVTADSDVGMLGAVHHDSGVPAQQSAIAALNVLIPGERRLFADRDGVDVVGGDRLGSTDTSHVSALAEHAQHTGGPDGATLADQLIEGVRPLTQLLTIDRRVGTGSALVRAHRISVIKMGLQGLHGAVMPGLLSNPACAASRRATRRWESSLARTICQRCLVCRAASSATRPPQTNWRLSVACRLTSL